MTDSYWNRQQSSILPTGVLPKRPRSDYDATPSGLPATQMSNYYARDDESARFQTVKDTKTIGSAYDRYLQNAAQAPPFASGDANALSGVGMVRPIGGGMAGYPVPDPTIAGRSRAAELDLAPNGRESGLIGQAPLDMLPRPVRDTVPLPPDASNTLYVEGLPSDCRRREVAHIFRPFVGYREVRLVSKEARARGGDPITLCFVDFENAACAATAMSALQGYKMDELDPDSKSLRLQFSRNPGPRSGSGGRGRR